MFKGVSGPGQLKEDLFVLLISLGFHLYPWVPNITAFTKETDHNYGPFRTSFWSNLDIVTEKC